MYKRAIVLDIITHPHLLTDQIIKNFSDSNSPFKLSKNKKPEFIKSLPRNSIIGSFVDNKNIFIAIPFFSSHLSLPLKVQEEVWIYEDQYAATDFENEYYWVSRVHGTNFYEDANFTHTDRKYLKDYNPDNKVKLDLENLREIQVALFNNGPVRGNDYNNSGNNTLNAIDKKIKKSLNLASSHLLEDIPRTTKNPGDYVIQGSNNTLIRLGTNHLRQSNFDFTETYNSSIFFKEPEPYSGTIDLVAGRAALSQSLGVFRKSVDYIKNSEKLFTKNVTTAAYKNSQFVIYNEYEIAENLKDNEFYLGQKNPNLAEGDPDFYTDTSRIVISEYLNGDELLNYESLNTVNQKGIQENVSNNKKRGFIIAKSDEIRLVARDLVITKSHEKYNQLDSSNQFQEGGSIRLIKEGGFSNRGYVAIDQTGYITIDGPAIVIGDKRREKSNGKGENIYLGNDSHEPGVLGYMLKNKLENFMDETIRALNIIGACLKDLDTHVHQYAGPAGQTLPPSPGTSVPGTLPNFTKNEHFLTYTDVTTNAKERSGTPDDKNGEYGTISPISASSEKLIDKISDIAVIRDSLNDILSKLVKTL